MYTNMIRRLENMDNSIRQDWPTMTPNQQATETLKLIDKTREVEAVAVLLNKVINAFEKSWGSEDKIDFLDPAEVMVVKSIEMYLGQMHHESSEAGGLIDWSRVAEEC